MKLASTYDKQEDIPEAFRELFTEDKHGRWRLTEVEGIKTTADVETLKRALDNERDEHKKTRAMKGELEEPTTDARGTHQLVLDHALATLAPLSREIDQATRHWTETDAAVVDFNKDDAKRAVLAAARAVLTKANVLPEAMEDGLLFAERDLQLDDKGRITTKDGGTLEHWLAEAQTKRPHWWPIASGGGALGGSLPWFKRERLENPWARENWNITDQGRFVQLHGTIKAEQYARKAGSRVGATEPPPPRM